MTDFTDDTPPEAYEPGEPINVLDNPDVALAALEKDREYNHLSDDEHMQATATLRKALDRQEPEYEWGIRVDGYGTVPFNGGGEERAREFEGRAPEYTAVRRTVGPWEDA
jgi:hypothetical protein